jgi:hypothetical protein
MRLVSFFLFFFLTSFSQTKKRDNYTISESNKDGFVVVINTNNITNEKILLTLTYGTEKREAVVDSATIKSNGQQVILKNDKKVIGGIYQLKFANVKEPIFLALDNGENVELSIQSTDLGQINCLKSEINKDFIAYQLSKKNTSKKDLIAYRNRLIKKHPKSVLALYFRVENRNEEELPKDEKTKALLYENYFKSVDKNDRRMFLLPNVYRLLYGYVNLIPLTNRNYTKSIDNVFKNLI